MLVGISYTWWLMLVSDKGTLDHLSEWVEIAQDIKLKKITLPVLGNDFQAEWVEIGC